jgi:hypothetical protein
VHKAFGPKNIEQIGHSSGGMFILFIIIFNIVQYNPLKRIEESLIILDHEGNESPRFTSDKQSIFLGV